jgi:hypothetical protein
MKPVSAILLFVITVISFSCRKDKDETAPLITISSPAENQQFSALDTVWVTITAEDETALQQVNITLTDDNKVPVLSTYTITLQDKKVTFTIPYTLNDINLTSGNYYIWVRASDGVNIHDKYRTIHISAVPQELKYLYVFTSASSTTIHVLRKEPQGSLQQIFDISGDFTSSAVSSKFQIIYTCGNIYGNLYAFDVSGNNEIWSIPVVSNPPFPYFESIGYYNNNLYASFYDGYIKGYNKNGTSSFTATCPSGSYPVRFCAGTNYLYADHAMYSGTSRIFGVYYLSSGALKQQIYTDYEAVDIFEKDNDNAFIFANKNGQGIIELYSISGNGVWEPHTLPTGKINDVLMIDENNYIIAHEIGIYKYQYNNNSLTSFVSGINATSVKYDPTTSEVYATSGSDIMIYDYVSHALQNTIAATDSILDFQLLYNKE